MLLTPALLCHNDTGTHIPHNFEEFLAFRCVFMAQNASSMGNFTCLEVCCYGIEGSANESTLSLWIWTNESAPL